MAQEINLKEVIKFHGHLGPYLVLGLIGGSLALKKIGSRKHFGLKVLVYGANEKPKSCLIDGLQLSTGATYGKGNIEKYKAKTIKIEVYNLCNKKRVSLTISKQLTEELQALKSHIDSEKLAKGLLKISPGKIFNLAPKQRL